MGVGVYTLEVFQIVLWAILGCLSSLLFVRGIITRFLVVSFVSVGVYTLEVSQIIFGAILGLCGIFFVLPHHIYFPNVIIGVVFSDDYVCVLFDFTACCWIELCFFLCTFPCICLMASSVLCMFALVGFVYADFAFACGSEVYEWLDGVLCDERWNI